MAQWEKTLCTKPGDDLDSWWKERADFCKLSSLFHM